MHRSLYLYLAFDFTVLGIAIWSALHLGYHGSLASNSTINIQNLRSLHSPSLFFVQVGNLGQLQRYYFITALVTCGLIILQLLFLLGNLIFIKKVSFALAQPVILAAFIALPALTIAIIKIVFIPLH